MKTLLKRMIGASRLDVQTYEEVEADRTSTTSAVFVVIVASMAAAVGSGARDFGGLIITTVMLLLTWLVWVALTYVIGTQLLPGPETHADLGEVLRTTGFSAAPGILRILGLIPSLGMPIFLGVTVWMLFSFVIAIRQALDYNTSARAVAVCLLGWLIHGGLFFAMAVTAI